jgi:hypothetical protein
MADMPVADVRKLIDGLRRDRRRHPYSGRGEYSQRARAVAAVVADMIEARDAAGAGPQARRAVERVTAALMYMDDSASQLAVLQSLLVDAHIGDRKAASAVRSAADQNVGSTCCDDLMAKRHRRGRQVSRRSLTPLPMRISWAILRK